MKILKIALKAEEIEIQYEKFSDAGGRELHGVRSTDTAAPSFYANISRLKEHFLNTLDLPEQWGSQGLCIVGLTVSYEDALTEYSIVAEKSIRGFRKVMTLKTPRGMFIGQAAEDLELVCRSAELFVLGERAQLAIPFPEQPAVKGKKGKQRKATFRGGDFGISPNQIN